MNKEIVVPDEPGAKVNQPFDIGALDLKIQPKIKIGKPVPPFEGKNFAGKPVKLSDFRGRAVLLYFWAASAVRSSDLQILKDLHNTYGKDDKLVVLGMNLDFDAKTAEQFATDKGMVWPQVHLGQWSQTQVPAMFGVEGYPVGVLIDAQGKLAAQELRGNALRNVVRNTLAARERVEALNR